MKVIKVKQDHKGGSLSQWGCCPCKKRERHTHSGCTCSGERPGEDTVRRPPSTRSEASEETKPACASSGG